MKSTWLIAGALSLGLVATGAMARQGSGPDMWVEGWQALEIIENNGGFAAAGLIDFISEGTGGGAHPPAPPPPARRWGAPPATGEGTAAPPPPPQPSLPPFFS